MSRYLAGLAALTLMGAAMLPLPASAERQGATNQSIELSAQRHWRHFYRHRWWGPRYRFGYYHRWWGPRYRFGYYRPWWPHRYWGPRYAWGAPYYYRPGIRVGIGPIGFGFF